MADKEDAIWRAIGILTQRVRDLEQPMPEPPLCACGHSKREHEVFGVCQGSECGCMGYALPKPAQTIQPEASQPLPAEVEAVFKDARSKLLSGPVTRIWTSDALDIVIAIQQSLAALWPKAGQVPSVADIKEWFDTDERESIQYRQMKAIRLQSWLLSRMGQPAKGDQPSPVTAEKLAEYLREEMSHWPSPVSTMAYSAWEGLAQGILKAFPSLGQGLTREQIAKAVVKRVLIPTSATSAWATEIADDLLALQGPMTVSKEQWEKLVSRLESRHVILQPAIVFRQWLKAELGMEVPHD